jgi:hypothetical protein
VICCFWWIYIYIYLCVCNGAFIGDICKLCALELKCTLCHVAAKILKKLSNFGHFESYKNLV